MQNSRAPGSYISKLCMSQIASHPSAAGVGQRMGRSFGRPTATSSPAPTPAASNRPPENSSVRTAFNQINQVAGESVPQPCLASYVSQCYRALRCASVFYLSSRLIATPDWSHATLTRIQNRENSQLLNFNRVLNK